MPTQLDIFYDYTCEDSYALSGRLLKLRASYPDVLLQWKAFPLEWQNGETHGVPAQLAFRAARAVRLQGEGAFYRFHPRLFAAYHEHGQDISDPAVVHAIADAAGLDLARWAADAGLAPGGQTAALDATITADFQEAQDNFVFGTPTVIVAGEGRLFNPGALGPHAHLLSYLVG